MTFLVRIMDSDGALEVASDDTILDAALDAGIAYPHGCRAGRCGACKSRLLGGRVELLKHTPFALSEEEKDGGLILACRAQPRSDCTVAWLAPTVADQALLRDLATE